MSVEAKPTASVVVPAFNEEARLAALFEALSEEAENDLDRAGFRYLEAIIVDDGSSDATSGLLSGAAAKDPRIRPVLGRARNLGKGRTVREGVAAARGDWVLIVDADLSTPLSDASHLSRALDSGVTVAIGSRVLDGADVIAPRRRRLIGSIFNRAVRGLTGLEFADTQSGFKLLRREVATQLLEEQICAGFAFDVELLMRARMAGIAVAEVPVSYRHDDRSKVKIPSASLAMARDLVRLRMQLGRAR